MGPKTAQEIDRLRRLIRLAIREGDIWEAARLHRLVIVLERWNA